MQLKRLISLAALVIILAGGIFVPVRAQDGGTLNDDELALVQRVIDARDQYEALDSVVEDITFSRTQGATIRLGEQFKTIKSASNWTRNSSVINEQDGRNIDATITADVENSQTTAEGKTVTSSLSLSIETRLVDGKLYVSASYPESVASSEDLPPLPDGWTEITTLDDWPVLQGVGLDDLLEDKSIMDNRELFRSAVTSASVEQTTLDDGTAVDVITLDLGAEGLKALYLDQFEPNDPASQLLTYTNDESSAVLEITLTADGYPYRAVSTVMLRMTDIDPALIGATNLPAEATVDFALDSVQDETYSQINEPLEPAAVPEELAQ